MVFLSRLLSAPLTEEILFRGPLIVGMWVLHIAVARHKITARTRNVLVLVLACLTSVLLFALAHSATGVYNVLSAGVFGVAAATMTIRTKSLVPGIISHALYNATGSLI
ncbi:CPBP family intramembrane glutamic endopeptidase (plasmid) [Arthrobacter sp. G.S.26]|uniref:CPBP family intramembrane glutamic endopeptidase n=1 Tax=Arthrobacter sp. G.S.26 TaxID=3433706 RepID=UPI003D7826AD